MKRILLLAALAACLVFPGSFKETLEKAIISFNKGDYGKMFEILKKASKALDVKDPEYKYNKAVLYKWYGNAYMGMNDTSSGYTYYEDALSLLEEVGGDKADLERGRLYNNLGALNEADGDYDSALDYFDKACGIYEKLNETLEIMHTELNKAYLFEGMGEYDRALAALEGIIAASADKAVKDDDILSKAYLAEGNVCFKLKKYNEALQHYIKSNIHFAKLKSKIGIAMTFANLGITNEKLGALGLAKDFYIKALENSEKIRGQLRDQKMRATFGEGSFFVYEKIITLCVNEGAAEDALYYIERAKARAFLDMLGNKMIPLRTKNREFAELLDREREYALKIESSVEIGEIEKLSEELDGIYEKIKAIDPEYAGLKTADVKNAAELRARIPDDMIFVDYFIGEYGAYAALFSGNLLKVITIPMRPAVMIERILKFRSIAVEPGWSIFDSSYQDILAELYDVLLKPLEKEISAFGKICVIPHGILHHLPFNALVYEKDTASSGLKKPKFAIEKYPFIFSPSINIFVETFKEEQSYGNILIIGNAQYEEGWAALPNAELEAAAIEKKFTEKKVLIGKKALETTVKKEAPNYNILHFATHGQLLSEEPLNSRILLTKGGRDDGSLTVKEIFNMDLKASLVVLSACETAKLGSFSSDTKENFPYGDDLLGLTRAFVYAGVPSIVASLWEVSDAATMFIMDNFYDNLKTMDKVEALRQAQIRLMKSEEGKGVNRMVHPNYWAPFIMFGY